MQKKYLLFLILPSMLFGALLGYHYSYRSLYDEMIRQHDISNNDIYRKVLQASIGTDNITVEVWKELTEQNNQIQEKLKILESKLK